MKRIAATLIALALSSPALAATACDKGEGFDAWLKEFRKEAIAEGIPKDVVKGALDGITYDRVTVGKDRGQSTFSQTFLEFSGRMVEGYRIGMGKKLIEKNKAAFAAVEREYGVPPEVITGFWGLETDFGANMGDMETIRSVATLAYDCRRPEMFRDELKQLLRVIERGDLTAADMRGPWAGELGQFQFLPSYYLDFAVDGDGDGKRDLIRSTPDALASAANLIRSFGWKPGEPWLQEVRLPERIEWQEAEVNVFHPLDYWRKAGVKPAQGDFAGAGQASLLLPMGHNGPAFLAYENFQAYLKWNQSLVYSTTAAYYATRLDGAPQVSPGRAAVQALDFKTIREMQKLLIAQGLDVGEADGKLGLATRAAVRQLQAKAGLPADGYPDRAFYEWLQGQ